MMSGTTMSSTIDTLVLISIDTLRSDLISGNPYKLWPALYGEDLRAPATADLDALVAEGAFFPNCIVAAPYTSASHGSYFTGKWPLRHGVFEVFNRGLAATTIFEMSKRKNYTTIFKTDFPVVLGKFLGFDRGIDDYLIEEDDQALDLLERRERAVAFFHFAGLHTPYGFHNLRFGGDAYRQFVAHWESALQIPPTTPSDQLVATFLGKEDYDLLMRYNRIVQYLYLEKQYRSLFQFYLDGAAYFFDNRFRPFFSRLREILRQRNHVLVVFGDHGEEYSEESFGHFNSISEGVLRCPVIVGGPGVARATYPTRIRSVDVAATVAELLQVGAPAKTMDGVSLLPTIRNREPYTAKPAIAQAYVSQIDKYVKFQKRVLRKGRKTGTLDHVRYKEVIYSGDFKLTRQTHEYDRPFGMLTPCYPKLELSMQARTLDWKKCSNVDMVNQLGGMLDAYNAAGDAAKEPSVIPANIKAQLRVMGYKI